MKLVQPWMIGLLCGFLIGRTSLQFWTKSELSQVSLIPIPREGQQESLFMSTERPILLHQQQLSKTARSKVGERVLCWLIVLQVTEVLRARVESGWGRHCDRVYYVTREGNIEDNVIAHHYVPLNKDLWNQVHRGWTRIAEIGLQDYDWFVKLDDDSLFFADNLRFLVRHKRWSPDSIAYFGHTIFEQSRPVWQPRSQFNLGAGYGVSRKLLELIYPYLPNSTSSIPKEKRCPEWIRWGEDVKFSDCLRVRFPVLVPNNTRDEADRETFLPFTPWDHIVRSKPNWYLRGKSPHLQNLTKTATGCCSSRPILWHKCSTSNIFFVYYMQMEVMVDPIGLHENNSIFGD
jgi:hypothetical protein